MNISHPRVSRLQSLAEKALRACPEVILHPAQLAAAARGTHWATLNMIDHPWLRDLHPRTLLDVGANAGQFTSASLIVFPKAHIYAFEPLPAMYKHLTERFANESRVKVFPFALGSTHEFLSMNENSFSESSSLLQMARAHSDAFPWTNETNSISVEIRSLDSMAPELSLINPVLLKVDVQGFECEVLKGATSFLDCVDYLLIETSLVELYEGEPTFDEVYKCLRAKDFVLAGVLDRLNHPRTGAPLQLDAFFRRAAESKPALQAGGFRQT